jgi:nitrogen fixation protein FixH
MKFNWGIGIGIVYATFAISMILFAFKASHQKYDLVTENYYDEAVNYQKKIDAGRNAESEGVKLDFNYSEKINSLVISTLGKQQSTSGTFTFYKPDKAIDDFKVDYLTDSNGKQILSLGKRAHGYWDVTANWTINGKECMEEKRIFIP